MSLENRPRYSRIPAENWIAERNAYLNSVDRAYNFLAAPEINPNNPTETLTKLFTAAVHVEAQVAQVVSMSLGRGITELATRGVPLHDIVQIQLPNAKATELADAAANVHDVVGGPPLGKEFMRDSLRDVVFPLAGMGTAFNAIASLGDERRVQHRSGIVHDIQQAPPAPITTYPDVYAFMNEDAQNPETARKAFEVGLNTLLGKREERDAYHEQLADPSIKNLPPQLRKGALIGIRATFGGKMIAELLRNVTPDTVPGATKNQLAAFSHNIVAYVILPTQ